jgi:hypothetical protein
MDTITASAVARLGLGTSDVIAPRNAHPIYGKMRKEEGTTTRR